MFDIKTQLKRTGRDSVYSWDGKDPAFTVALQGALLGVLAATQQFTLEQVAGVSPAGGGSEDMELSIEITAQGLPYFSLSAEYANCSVVEVRATMAALTAAVAPFRDAAARVKA